MSRTSKILSVEMNAQIPKKDGGSYPGINLTLQHAPGQLGTKGIHEKVAANNPTLVSKLQQVANGETKDAAVVMEKNDRGYLDVVDVISDASAGTQAFTGRAAPGASFHGGKTTSGSASVETTVRIARQNALAAAVQVSDTAEKALKVAVTFTDFLLESEGIDHAGKSLKKTESVDARDEVVKEKTPF